jgi:hypothetical protein
MELIIALPDKLSKLPQALPERKVKATAERRRFHPAGSSIKHYGFFVNTGILTFTSRILAPSPPVQGKFP